MKNFDDLLFKELGIGSRAVLNFENGYGVSVVFGYAFYSNGIDTYELAVFYNGVITYNTSITNDVIPGIKKDEVSEIMKQIQKLTPPGEKSPKSKKTIDLKIK